MARGRWHVWTRYYLTASGSPLAHIQAPSHLLTNRPYTTRNPWPGELHARQYFYVTHQKFKDLIQEGAFPEYAEFSSNSYGTSLATVRQVGQQGKRCILDIKVQVCK